MSYTPPALTPGGVTWAQLQTFGFQGTIEKVARANGLAAPVVSRLRSSESAADAVRAYSALLDQFLDGTPIAIGEVAGRMNDLATIFHSLAQAADEINALVAANPGTIRHFIVRPTHDSASSTGQSVKQSRTWY